MKKYNLRPMMTIIGLIVPFVIAAFLYNSTKSRNDKIIEIETTALNSEAIKKLQANLLSMNDVISDLSRQFSVSRLEYEEITEQLHKSKSNGQSNRETTKLLNNIIERQKQQSEQIKELQRRMNFAEIHPDEIEDIVIDTFERLLRTNR